MLSNLHQLTKLHQNGKIAYFTEIWRYIDFEESRWRSFALFNYRNSL